MTQFQPKTLLITGVSSGLGRAFAAAALADGHTVFGTVRTDGSKAAFESTASGRARAVVMTRLKNRIQSILG